MANDRSEWPFTAAATALGFSPLSVLLGNAAPSGSAFRLTAALDAFPNGAPTVADGTPDYAQMAFTFTYAQLGDFGTAVQLAKIAAQGERFASSREEPPTCSGCRATSASDATTPRSEVESQKSASRLENHEYCLGKFVRCNHLHGHRLLNNGKTCDNCFDMCTLYGYWPTENCPGL